MTEEKKNDRPRGRDVHRRQRSKNLVVLGLLVALVLLFYVLSIVRMGGLA